VRLSAERVRSRLNAEAEDLQVLLKDVETAFTSGAP